MAQFVDRRLNPRDKSLGNRQRFLRRVRSEVKRAVDKAVAERAIADVTKGGSVSIPSDGIDEPQFHLSREKWRARVRPARQQGVRRRRRIDKPKKGGGGGGGREAGVGTRRGPVLLRADRGGIPRHPVRGSRASRSRQDVAQGRQGERVPPRWLHQRRRDAESGGAAHHARQHGPAARAAPPEQGRSRGARGGTRGVARRGRASRRAAAHRPSRARDRAAEAPAARHSVHRSDRRALQPVLAGPRAARQGGDVLPDGRVGLDGRAREGARQAVLHPPAPVPQAEVRARRHRLHPSHRRGGGGRRAGVLLRPRDRRHRGQHGAEGDAGDPRGALPGRGLERLLRPGLRRRQFGKQLARVRGPAGADDPAAGPVLRLYRDRRRGDARSTPAARNCGAPTWA